jgi:SAM-dependent methyltransferase
MDMLEKDKEFTGGIPELYELYMVPLIFQGYAADLASRVSQANPEAVLEVAAGTGVVTRALEHLLARDVEYIATDLNQDMLDHAASIQGSDSTVLWQRADALNLPFEDSAFYVVVCQFGVMFFPVALKRYAEAKRVLKPGGKLIFNVWGAIEHNEFAKVVTDAIAEIFPDNPPQFLARTPHGYFDFDHIRSDLRAAGIGTVEIDTLSLKSNASNPTDPAVAFCQGTPLTNEICQTMHLCWITLPNGPRKQLRPGMALGQCPETSRPIS